MSKSKGTPGHVYEHTQKWQTNGPREWGPIFTELSKRPEVPAHLRGKQGAGIRLALDAGIKALAGQKVKPASKAIKAKATKAAKAEISTTTTEG